MKKFMLFSIVVCMCMVMFSISFAAEGSPIRFHGCSPKYPDLCATNESTDTVHLFLTMEFLGCNGAKTPQPGAKYKLIKDVDYTDGQLNASYFWKISHYNHFVIPPGHTAVVQNAPCYEGMINYGKLGRTFIFTPEKWEYFKANVYQVNPKCPWAQPEKDK